MNADPLGEFKSKIGPLIEKWTTQVNRPRNVQIVFQDETHEPPAHDILDYAANNNVHFLCVGANVRRLRENKNYMGSTSTVLLANCVRQGVPVCVAHYDERFAAVGQDSNRSRPVTPEPLPKTAMFATPGPAAAWDHKYRCNLSIGATLWEKSGIQ